MNLHHNHPAINSVDRESASNQRKMLIALSITFVVMVAEIIGGFLANSLALLSDAGHMLTDILALGLSTLAMKFSRKPPTPSKTFGFYRLEILAAFFNGILLLGIACYIFYESYQRIINPEAIAGVYMLGVATIGLLANGAGILLLRKSSRTNLNIRSAFYHIIGDTISSAGVIVGGILIVYTGWNKVDALISFLIGILILSGAYRLVIDAVDIFLEATPKDIDVEQLLADICKIEGVRGVHHIHLWTISTGIYAMSAHVLIDDLLTSRSNSILRTIEKVLRENYKMEHTTIQFESGSCSDELLKNHGACG